MKLSYLDLMTTDPSYNLAMEQYVFDCLPRDRMYFMLWQNDNAIIVGKYQNTISEINEEAVRERGIRVVRRLSGGGAVYHDMGNLNFTFITDAGGSGTLDMKLFCEPVVRTLAALGVKAEVNGRNDITIDGKKFSGNSQYLRQGRVMHHGTIMFDSDLSVVGEALRVDPTKIQTKGIRSVRSRVTNVAEHLPERVTLPEFRRILLENILRENPGEEYPLTPDDLAAVEKLRAERYATWEWNYGKSPACTMLRRSRVDGCGLIEAYITVEHGLVSAVTFKGDFFSAEEPEALAARFVGHTPDRAGYTAALDGDNTVHPSVYAYNNYTVNLIYDKADFELDCDDERLDDAAFKGLGVTLDSTLNYTVYGDSDEKKADSSKTLYYHFVRQGGYILPEQYVKLAADVADRTAYSGSDAVFAIYKASEVAPNEKGELVLGENAKPSDRIGAFETSRELPEGDH